MEHLCYYLVCGCSKKWKLEHASETRLLIMEIVMSSDVIVCDTCGTEKNWMRFRLRLGNGTTKEVSTCSTCRQKKASAESSKQIRLAKQAQRQVVLNRTHHEKQLILNVPHYYPKIESQMRAYANKKTAMDRKYLRDHQDKPLSLKPHLAAKQQIAQEHAKGWIAFYDEILNHAINLLRQTGTRPTWAQLEGKSDLHRLYGVWNTRRAQLLRERG